MLIQVSDILIFNIIYDIFHWQSVTIFRQFDTGLGVYKLITNLSFIFAYVTDIYFLVTNMLLRSQNIGGSDFIDLWGSVVKALSNNYPQNLKIRSAVGCCTWTVLDGLVFGKGLVIGRMLVLIWILYSDGISF